MKIVLFIISSYEAFYAIVPQEFGIDKFSLPQQIKLLATFYTNVSTSFHKLNKKPITSSSLLVLKSKK